MGRLPNHEGPVFVRRRRKSFANPFGVPSVISLWAPRECQSPATTYYEQQPQSSTMVTQQPTYTVPPQVVQPPAYLGLPPPAPVVETTTTTTTQVDVQPQSAPSKHSCAACGKFRSARYQYRHPLAPGETPRPTLCRKCVKQHTSSEESDETERARWKKREQEARQRRRHRSYSSDDWESSSSHEERRRHHRHRSSTDGPSQRRSARSSSGVSNRIYIIRRTAEKPRARPQSSSESVRIVRRARSTEDRPRLLPRPRYRYGPFDGHHSYEDYHSDEHEADGFGRRGRSRSRSISRQSHEDSHSIDDDYVRISTRVSTRRPLSLLDRLDRSRSRSSSRSRWRRRRPDYEENVTRITIHSRDPSPVRYERHEEEEYEERIENPIRSPWGHGCESMIAHRDSATIETHSDDYFDHHRHGGRSLGLRSPPRSLRAHSPSILRRRSEDHSVQNRRRVRFARSDESEEEFHAGKCSIDKNLRSL